MRRFAFYFLIGLLTFSSGIFTTYQLPGLTPAEIEVTVSGEFPEAVLAAHQPQNDNEDHSEEFERDQMKCYQPLIGRWLGGRPIKEEV